MKKMTWNMKMKKMQWTKKKMKKMTQSIENEEDDSNKNMKQMTWNMQKWVQIKIRKWTEWIRRRWFQSRRILYQEERKWKHDKCQTW